jgi:hypothetical protein
MMSAKFHAALSLLIRSQGEAVPRSFPNPKNEIDQMINEFDNYLVNTCGLAIGTLIELVMVSVYCLKIKSQPK